MLRFEFNQYKKDPRYMMFLYQVLDEYGFVYGFSNELDPREIVKIEDIDYKYLDKSVKYLKHHEISNYINKRKEEQRVKRLKRRFGLFLKKK